MTKHSFDEIVTLAGFWRDGRSCTTPADIDDRVQVEIAGDRIIRIDGLG